ncbi:MAG: bifunctional riboflavin kinase/FAD synthetase [Armatimonadetes bacterium]|nr:bifunctional riboflavin kinase/FAD synthetase [Armatimonadota bacterium]
MQQLQGGRPTEGIPAATAVAIGMFDGVHLGHQALIRRTMAIGQEQGLTPLVLTFDRHADEILRPDRARPYLTTLSEKVAAIKALGVAHVVVARVTPSFLAIKARDFVTRYLRGELHARAVVVGPDFRFGQGRQGDVALLTAMQRECRYKLEVLPPVLLDGEPVSSTLIRRTLSAGDVRRAAVLMGHPYQLTGEVTHGEEVGRTLGFPTANLVYPPQKILPALGVYLCRARTADACYGAAVNVGRRPTFDGTRITVEAHLLDFAGDLYGQKLTLEFLERLRAEQKFASAADLRAQITADVEHARQAFARHESEHTHEP